MLTFTDEDLRLAETLAQLGRERLAENPAPCGANPPLTFNQLLQLALDKTTVVLCRATSAPENHQRDCVLSREPRLRGSLSGSDDVEGGGCQRREPCERSELGRGRNLAVVEFVLPRKKVAVFTYGR